MSSLLPLFPLDVVLLPYSPLPLHIFEPRYKEMIGECLDSQSVFGVVHAVENGIAEIGCTAEIVAVTKRYPDGRLDIVTEGRERFEIRALNQERDFLRGEVSIFDDEPGSGDVQATDRAVQLHGEILSLAGAVQDLSAANPDRLSFFLAGSLPLDLNFKQHLLGVRSEGQRVAELAEHLAVALPNLRRAARARQKVGGNGRVH